MTGWGVQYDHPIPVERHIDAEPERLDLDQLIASLRPSWMAKAACTPDQADLFFPERGEDADEAKRICAGCTVRRECLTAALVNNERSGIWGGLSGKERRRLRRTASAAAIAAAPLPPIVYTSVARAESIAERRSNGGRFTRAEANRAAIAATVVEIGPRRATGRILEGASR